MPLIQLARQPSETEFLLENIERSYYYFSSDGLNFPLSHTVMILGAKILVIIKYPLAILKPMIDTQYI